MKDRYAAIALMVGAALFASLLVVFLAATSDGASATNAATSDNASYIFLFVGVVLPGIFLYFATRNQDEKAKNKRGENFFDKPKRDDMEFTIGDDGELIPYEEDDETFEAEHQQQH